MIPRADTNDREITMIEKKSQARKEIEIGRGKRTLRQKFHSS